MLGGGHAAAAISELLQINGVDVGGGASEGLPGLLKPLGASDMNGAR